MSKRMRQKMLRLALVIGLLVTGAAAQHSAVTPVARDMGRFSEWWVPRHEAIVERAKQGNVDLLFIGDSITHFWEDSPIWRESGQAVWDQYYARRKPLNLGFAGDQTGHVLWRLDHGEVDGISPKLAIVMIGTNNFRSNTAEEIADGIEAVVKKLREKLPNTKVLLLAIFPRGEKPGPDREKLAKASELASRVADGDMVHYLDIGKHFLDGEGNIPKDVMPDFLHPNAKGYAIWAEVIEPMVKKLMGEE